MGGLRAVIIAAVFTALIRSVGGEHDKPLHARDAHHPDPVPCTNQPGLNPFAPPCPSTSTQSTSNQDGSDDVDVSTSTSATDTSTSQPTSLERAHWCRFSNGTYVPLGHTFMHTTCTMCQCTTARTLRCQALECLPTYCIDNTMPYRKDGQCCAQCGYEPVRNSCVHNGVSFPHGVVMKSVESKTQCWCQLGNIECRDYIGTLYDSLNMLSDEKTIYIIVAILAIVLIFGSLICCGGTFFFYYYYQRNQHTFQQAYDQYINSAGWQPMNEDEQTEGDATAEDKQFEAEKYQASEFANEMVPPPYAIHNESYVPEDQQKRM